MEAALFHTSRHLAEEELCPPDRACRFCGSEGRDPVWTLQQAPAVQLLRCRDCAAISASRMPTDEALDAYYGSYYSNAGNAQAAHVTIDRPERLADRLATDMGSAGMPREARILDFGGGDGTISRLLAERLASAGCAGVSVSVVDYDDRVIPSEDARVGVRRLASLDAAAGTYEWVLASAVIEHYAEPADLLHRLLSRVGPRGFFYARTPSMVPLMKLLGRVGIHVDFTYPGHLHDLGQRFWEDCFRHRHTDFAVLRSRPSIVETTLSRHFLRTVAALSLKMPWYVLGRRYGLVGGWEILVQRNR